MLDRLDFILRLRLKRTPAICGAALLGTLALSLLLFLLIGNGRVERTMFFPSQLGRRMVAEQRFLPRRGSLERDIQEVAEGVLLGPARPDAQRLFPRGASVIAVMESGRTLYLDLSPAAARAGPGDSSDGSGCARFTRAVDPIQFPALPRDRFPHRRAVAALRGK